MPEHKMPEIDVINPESVPHAIASSVCQKTYRPTAVAVAQRDGRVLMAHFPKEPNVNLRWFVQGGIETDELLTPAVAATRELWEEVAGVGEVTPGACLGAYRYHNGRSRDGYSCGKLLIAFSLLLGPDSTPIPQVKETDEVVFYTPDEAHLQLCYNAMHDPNRATKAAFSALMVERAFSL